MIDWRIILGALAGGLALASWLESRHRLQQTQLVAARLLQGTAVFAACLAASLFVYAQQHPVWASSTQPRFDEKTAVFHSTTSISPTLAPPSVFILATPDQSPTNAPISTKPSTNHAYLHIPALDISQPIVDLPLQNGRWDVSQLGEKIGHLNSTGAQPGDALAPVFAGHMTFPSSALLNSSATLGTGAFANLQYATYDTEVLYETNGQRFVYKVTEISRVLPSEIERLYLEDGNSILLVTCTDWDENGRIYTNRLLIRATLSN